MISLDLFFQYFKWRCHDNQFCKKMANSPHLSLSLSKIEWDIATSMCALQCEWSLYMCKNFVNSGPATPEFTELIMNIWYDTAKIGVSSQISQDILVRFLQSFHSMKALCVQMIDLDLFFHGNRLMLGESNECRLIPPAFFAQPFKTSCNITIYMCA